METEFTSHEFDSGVLGFPASLHKRLDNGPVRPITTTRHARPVGRYYSVKNGRSLPWESRPELHAFYHSEVSSEVISYWVQPHKLKMVIGSKTCTYTPDREELLSDGSRRIIEVKDKFKAERDPIYTLKLEHAHAVYRLSGSSYFIQERAEIEAQPAFDTVEAIQSFRRTAVTPHDILLIHEAFAGNSELPFGAARDLFKTPALGFAKLSAMIVRRILVIDHTRPLNPETPVSIHYRN